MATVYRGFDTMLEVDRAVKVLSPALCSSEKLRKRFLAEARAMAKLRHPNIVTVFDVGVDDNTPYIVMEIVDGGAVIDWLERDGPQSVDVAGHIMLGTLAGLQASHDRGVVHRDVKPHNLLLTSDGVVKLTDFGIAQLEDERSFTKTGAVMGTLAYMPPEQRVSAKGLGPSSDVFAAGASLYALLTGREPFDIYNESLHEKLFDGVPEPMRRVILRACQYEPEARHQSASEMAADLREAMLEMGLEIRPQFRVPLPKSDPGTVFAMDEAFEPPPPAMGTAPESTTINPKGTWFPQEAFGGEGTSTDAFGADPKKSATQKAMIGGMVAVAAVLAGLVFALNSGDGAIEAEIAPTAPSAKTLKKLEMARTDTTEAPVEAIESAAVPSADPAEAAKTPAASEPSSTQKTAVETNRSAPKAVAAPERALTPEPVAAPVPVAVPEAVAVPAPAPAKPAAVEQGEIRVRVNDSAATLLVNGVPMPLTNGTARMPFPLGKHSVVLQGSSGKTVTKTVNLSVQSAKATILCQFNDDGSEPDCR